MFDIFFCNLLPSKLNVALTWYASPEFGLVRPRSARVRSIVMSMSVYMSICLSVHLHNSETTWLNFTKFFVLAAYWLDSPLGAL